MSFRPILLIATKLHRPSPVQESVSRPELLQRLHINPERKLTLISAPAGFGKTTLASQWIAGCEQPAAWLSLDAHDNQPVQFLHYLIAAVRTCFPDTCPSTYDLITAPQLPSTAYLTDSLVSELSVLPAALVLVLDDYHHIRSQEVHGILRHLLRYMPPSLHLVILTRFDPPLHLGRLRIAQQITELRSGDLRFGPEETHQFLDHRLRHPVDDAMSDEMTTALHDRTDGWVTGLELASISLQQRDWRNFLVHFQGNDRLLVGYLVEEVMAHLPADLQRFVVQLSLVDRFCAPLADALIADTLGADPSLAVSSHAIIAQLEEMNLFIVALDAERTWFRFHDLFREFLLFQLQRQWTADDLARLHRQASAWFANVGLIEDALRHSLAAGETVAAVELVINQFHPMVDRQLPGPTLMRWLAHFPPETIDARPELLLAKAWLSAFGIGSAAPQAQLEDIEARLQCDPLLSPARRQMLLADLNLLRGVVTYWRGDLPGAIEILEIAREQQPPTHAFAHAQILLHLAGAYTCTGRMAEGCRLLRTALAEETAQQRPVSLILLGGLAMLYLYAGELDEVIRFARQAVAAVDAAADRGDWQGIGFVDIWHGWAHYMLGMAHYEQNDRAAAAHHWQRVQSLGYHTNPNVHHGSLLGLALIGQIDGAPDSTSTRPDAWACTQAARAFASEVRRPRLLAVSDSFEVRLALRNGETQDAEHRTQEIGATAGQGLMFAVELPPLTRLRALIAVASPDALQEAVAFAEMCLQDAETVHNAFQIIPIRVLYALILHRLRRTVEACTALEKTLALAEPGGFLRTFLDLGAPMADLLRAFAAEYGESDYLKRIFVSFVQELGPDSQPDRTAEYAQRYGITPLTPRELEVLTLVGERRTQAEIADALVISISTVKNHTHNIYTKLGVRSGRRAVAKARDVGILPPA